MQRLFFSLVAACTLWVARAFSYDGGTDGVRPIIVQIALEGFGGIGELRRWHGSNRGFDLGVSGNLSRDPHYEFATTDTGRFAGLNTRAGAGTARDLIYSYTSNSSLVSGYGIVESPFSVTRGYESGRCRSEAVVCEQWTKRRR